MNYEEVDVVISMMTMTPMKYAVAEPSTPMYFEETVIVIPYWGHKSDTNITSPLSPGVLHTNICQSNL